MLSERQRRKIRRTLREMLQALDVPAIRYAEGEKRATVYWLTRPMALRRA